MEVIQSVQMIRGKSVVTFFSGWKVWFSHHETLPFPLVPGAEIDHTNVEKYILLTQYPSALDKAVNLLAQRARSRNEIIEKLRSAHYDQSVVEMVIYKLEKENLLNDNDFTDQWIQSRIKKYGSARILHELRIKGVDREIIHQHLEDISEEEQLEAASSIAIKKIKQISDKNLSENEIKKIVIGMLIRRGYSWQTASKALQNALSQE